MHWGLLSLLAQLGYAQLAAPVLPGGISAPTLPTAPIGTGLGAPGALLQAPASLGGGLSLPTLRTPSLSPAPVTPQVPAGPAKVPAVTPSPVPPVEVYARALAASGRAEHEAGGRRFTLLLRRGKNQFGHEVAVVDVVDAAQPDKGTVGHIDFSMNAGYGQAQLDGPLDGYVDRASRPDELSHGREHLWFGLAVLPEYRDLHLGKLLLELCVAMVRERGIPELYIYATESSRAFYLKHLAGHISFVEPFTGADEATYYRIRVDLSGR